VTFATRLRTDGPVGRPTSENAATLRTRSRARPSSRTRLLACGLLAALMPLAAFAHHSVLGKFDESSPLTLSGIVTYVDWRNPHAHVFVNVEGENRVANWAIELASPVDLERAGWRADTLRPGDAVTVTGIAARDGTRQVWGESIVFSSSGREVLSLADDKAPPLPLEPRPAPRWPDGQPALGRIAGMPDGYWGYPSSLALVEDGADVAMNADGLLADLEDAARVAPFQPWALALYRHRQGRSLKDDPNFLHCKPPGGPRQFQSNLGVQLIEDRDTRRVFVLIGSGNRNHRRIYLDGREHVGQVGGDDDNPLYYGRSVGEWQGDTLVVDTRGFNEDFWFTNGGLPHTSQLRLIERFSRPDADTLLYEVTVEDPGAYTRPWTSSWTLRWVSGEDLPVHFCQHNRP
jgi:hypothetical protein